MALGFSGSNGGIRYEESSPYDGEFPAWGAGPLPSFPLEVSFFINSVCNLSCEHCYVGRHVRSGIPGELWVEKLLGFARSAGARTIGCVGKEPLASVEKLLSILRGIREARLERLRYGLVTNGTLLTAKTAEELAAAEIHWLDVSLDGTREAHNAIRGDGAYETTLTNLRRLPPEMAKKVFVLFTLVDENADTFLDMRDELAGCGFTRFMVSPFVRPIGRKSRLGLSEETLVRFVDRNSDFSGEIVLKMDRSTSNEAMGALERRGFFGELRVDDYGVIYGKVGALAANWMPIDDVGLRQVRITDDGILTSCLDMFTQGLDTPGGVGGHGNIFLEEPGDLMRRWWGIPCAN